MLPYLEKAFWYDYFKDLEDRRLFWIIWMGLKCNHVYPYRGKQGRLKHMDTLEGSMKTGQKDLKMLTLKAEMSGHKPSVIISCVNLTGPQDVQTFG